jgi:DNA polymerase-3 subunit epsilon
MKLMDSGLFDLDDSAPAEEHTASNPMTALQRQTIRDLFAQIGVVDARPQFEMVAELTGIRITSVAELEVGPANVLIQMLRGRAARSGNVNTGNAWADREEDTWIDRL